LKDYKNPSKLALKTEKKIDFLVDARANLTIPNIWQILFAVIQLVIKSDQDFVLVV
jgi:hypothetical protein